MKKQIIYLSLITFVLHIIWENAHATLYQGYSFFEHIFSICLWATLGDVLITLSVFVIISLLKNNFNWIPVLNKKDIIVLAIIGLFIAIDIEWRALLFDRWTYTDSMPIVPYLKVGLTPILQMILLLPFSVYLTKKFTHIKDDKTLN